MVEVNCMLSVTCDRCKTAKIEFAITTQPDDKLEDLVQEASKYLEEQGWETDLDQETCPECLRIERNETIEENALKG